MSKAFTKDDTDTTSIVIPPRAPLPPGVTNYVTPRGHRALRDELEQLQAERAALGDLTNDDERLRTAASLKGRIAALEQRLSDAQEVDHRSQPPSEVRFGATVVVRDESGAEKHYRIVGVDEADVAHGDVAFVAPLARALLGRGAGDVVELRTPRGRQELVILSIAYDSDALAP